MLQNIILIGGNSMRKSIKNVESVFPMPVLMVATYNEDGNIMKAGKDEMDKLMNEVKKLHGYLQNVNFE